MTLIVCNNKLKAVSCAKPFSASTTMDCAPLMILIALKQHKIDVENVHKDIKSQLKELAHYNPTLSLTAFSKWALAAIDVLQIIDYWETYAFQSLFH